MVRTSARAGQGRTIPKRRAEKVYDIAGDIGKGWLAARRRSSSIGGADAALAGDRQPAAVAQELSLAPDGLLRVKSVSRANPLFGSPARPSSLLDEEPVAVGRTYLPRFGLDSFSFVRVIGRGSFGKVLLAEHRQLEDAPLFAVKVVKKQGVLEDLGIARAMAERDVLIEAAECPFVTRLYGTFSSADSLLYVMEFASGGDLMFHLVAAGNGFEISRARFYAAEIAVGLWWLHDHAIVYRDLKLDNVLLTEAGHVKLADFGMCKQSVTTETPATTFCGTPGYLAPEMIAEEQYGLTVDWWSYGVLLYEMITGHSPFNPDDVDDDDELFNMILTAPIPPPRGTTLEARSLLAGLLTRDPQDRLGCGPAGGHKLKSHVFFAPIEWAEAESLGLVPPFVPAASAHKHDATNFDAEFVSERASLTPPLPDELEAVNGSEASFAAFSYTAMLPRSPGQARREVSPPVPASRILSDTEDRRAATDAPSSAQRTVDGTAGNAINVYDFATATKTDEKSWFAPLLSRQEVIGRLDGAAEGAFLIRESKSQPDRLAISVALGGTQVWNGLISRAPAPANRSLYRMFDADQFGSLDELVGHYRKTPIEIAGRLVKLQFAPG